MIFKGNVNVADDDEIAVTSTASVLEESLTIGTGVFIHGVPIADVATAKSRVHCVIPPVPNVITPVLLEPTTDGLVPQAATVTELVVKPTFAWLNLMLVLVM